MFAKQSETIYEAVLSRRLITSDRLDLARAEASASRRSLADILIARGLIEKPVLLSAMAGHLGCEVIEHFPEALAGRAWEGFPGDLARKYGVVPVRSSVGRVMLLTCEDFDDEAVEDLTFVLGQEIALAIADPAEVQNLIVEYQDKNAHRPQVSVPGGTPDCAVDGATPDDDIAVSVNQAPVIQLVDQVLGRAIRDRASDIHFEPFEHEFKIRCRIDGTLYEVSPPPPRPLALSVISRIKVLANLDIAERRLPQDGRITFALEGRTIDLRVSTLPTQFGESVVLRVLDPSAIRLEIDDLGVPADILPGIKDVLARPNGIFIVTGPTGSGKTTTLYSGLSSVNTPELKLVTAEDPIEYEIDGLMQVPVNPAIGFTFAKALRAFLRQDPDVMMVGEIRDLETAQIAIQASLTGHLVLSTLHTNDAAGTITRLIDLGIEPFLLASSLEGILSQRLVRRICPHCRTVLKPTPELLAQWQMTAEEVGGRPLFSGQGCSHCGQTGYRGRRGIFEWLRLTDSIRELIGRKASTLEIRQQAIAEGMRTLREDGLRSIFAGHTTAAEVAKYT